jgi:hypothetical protein
VSWGNDSHRSAHVINDSAKSFQPKVEAENFGGETAKEWVYGQRVTDAEALEHSRSAEPLRALAQQSNRGPPGQYATDLLMTPSW